jgi:hypothetical protein
MSEKLEYKAMNTHENTTETLRLALEILSKKNKKILGKRYAIYKISHQPYFDGKKEPIDFSDMPDTLRIRRPVQHKVIK